MCFSITDACNNNKKDFDLTIILFIIFLDIPTRIYDVITVKAIVKIYVIPTSFG